MPVFLVHIYIKRNKIKKILEKFVFKGYYLFIVFFRLSFAGGKKTFHKGHIVL